MTFRRLAIGAAAIALALRATCFGAEPYTINVILSLTGPGTFIGNEQLQALSAVERLVNASGGIAGRQLHFEIKDDQSNPQVAVQLVRQILASGRIPAILGPSLAASCNAAAPLLQREGPVLYCLTAGVHPPPGGYVFSTLTSTPDLLAVGIRYFRERGLKRIAYIVTTDAGGQDAERGIVAAAAAAENKSVKIVAGEHFGATDISVSAQLARIKASAPDALIAWVTGTAAGTVLRAIHDAGLTLPTLISSANMTPSFIRQYARLLPKETYAPAMLYYAGNAVVGGPTRRAISTMNYAADVQGVKPDQVFISAWDPAMLVADALKRLGTEVSAAGLRRYFEGLRGWVGVNGPYDFRAVPQRGIGQGAVVVVRWNPEKSQFDPVSILGGAPATRR
jgi:branched-chain amino acid transport system substrate-binding protein